MRRLVRVLSSSCVLAACCAWTVAASVAQQPAPPPSPSPSPSPAPPGAAGSPDTHAGLRIDRFRWSRQVDGAAPIRALEIVNDYGDVRLRGSKERVLEASAVIQRLDAEGRAVGVTVERRGDVVALTVAYPAGRLQDAEPDPPKDRMDRLDLAVFVPAGVAVSARTIRGIVEARGLDSDVHAATRRGAIDVTTSGSVQARSAEGAITVQLQPAPRRLEQGAEAAAAPVVLQSGKGAVLLTLPPRGYEVRAETSGALRSDLPLARSSGGGRNRLSGVLGKGERQVLIHSDSGSIEVRGGPPLG
jgi:hypothetical protein